MIIDNLSNARFYTCLHPGLEAGFEFIQSRPLETLDEGKHIIDGQRLFAMAQKGNGKGKDGARLEAHDQYIDVQLSAAGQDIIGWKARGDCRVGDDSNPPSGDVHFFSNQPDSWLAVAPGSFAIFFPDDAHAPWGCEEWIHKIVLKIALDW